MTVECTLKLVKQSITVLSTGDLVAIAVSLISFLGIIIVAIMTNNTTKKISKSNEKLQEKWNQKNIDATLTASARIEWIQNVRNTTSVLIALYFKAINTVSKEELLETVIKAQEKTELLILYFGHEDKESINDNTNLCDKTNNENKNSRIVIFLSSLSKKLYRYYENINSGKLIDLENARDKRYIEMQDHVNSYEYEEYTDEYGNDQYSKIPILEEGFQKALEDIELRIKNLVGVSIDINKDILLLRDIIRIYLKIEWNKAKSGV